MFTNITLSEFAEINPKVTIPKGKEVAFVEMGDITPGRRYTTSKSLRKFTGGGSKFLAGDILFARITPCLENGKIAQYKAPQGTIAFGSTEFIVFRNKEGISDPSYVYYLLTSDFIRLPAIKSMSGASGRQRADISVISNIEIKVPDLPTQRKIAAILSAYDDLIENNTRRIKILEEMAQLLYREWFVKFRFPGHEKVRMVESELGPIPEGWEVKTLDEVCNIVMGQSPESKYYNTKGEGLPFHQGVSNFNNRYPTHEVYCTIDKRIAHAGDILFSVRAPVGRINVADRKLIVGRGLAAIRHIAGLQSFLYYQLKAIFKEEDIIGNGAIFNSITKQDLLNVKVIVPSDGVDNDFNNMVEHIDQFILNLTHKNLNLRRTRDLLLPKLISGELDVEDLDIAVGGD